MKTLQAAPQEKKELMSFCSPQEEVATKTQLFGSLLGRIQTFKNVSCDPSFQCVMKEKGHTGISA